MPQYTLDDKSTLVQVIAWSEKRAITWTNVDLDVFRHRASLDHNECYHLGGSSNLLLKFMVPRVKRVVPPEA